MKLADFLLVVLLVVCFQSILLTQTKEVKKYPFSCDTIITFPKPFAAGLITGSAPTFTPDGKTIYHHLYDGKQHTIKVSYFKEGQWTSSKTADFSGTYDELEPCITHDGSRLYFFSKRSINGEENQWNQIVYMEKTDTGWSKAKTMEPPITIPGSGSGVPSFTKDGTLYFGSTRRTGSWPWEIFYSKFVNGKYSDPININDTINKGYLSWSHCIAPDESFLIFCSERPDGFGKIDLYVSFRENGKWQPGINMGKIINTDLSEVWPRLSPDGKYLFFRREEDNGSIYQIDVKPLLEKVRKTANIKPANSPEIGKTWIKAADSTAFPPRGEHQVVEFKGKLWLIGGSAKDQRDVWFSDDAIHWKKGVADAGFAGGQAVVFKDKIWVIDANEKSVWNSEDGKYWSHVTKVDSFPEWAPRVVIYKNKIWLTGGANVIDAYLPDGKLNPNRKVIWKDDVWSSADGINWIKEKVVQSFPNRSDHSMVVFNNKMWVIAGQSGPNKNDIYNSDDGINWIHVSDAPFRARHVTQAIAFNTKLWVIGGFAFSDNGQPVLLSDIWNSEDGIHWNEVISSAPFGHRMEHQAKVYKNKIWLIGGQTGSFPNHTAKNDIWYTEF